MTLQHYLVHFTWQLILADFTLFNSGVMILRSGPQNIFRNINNNYLLMATLQYHGIGNKARNQ